MKYIIKDTIVDGGEIVGHEITDQSGSIKRIKYDDTVKLIERKLVDADIATDNNGNKHIQFKRIDTVADSKEMYTIECRVLHDGKVTNYKCKNQNGEVKRLSPTKLWELAALNKVNGIKAVVISGKKTIISNGVNIQEIPVLDL